MPTCYAGRTRENHTRMGAQLGLMLLPLLAMTVAQATALPRFSLLTGTHCSACHFSPHGSGIRTELGWSAMNQVGAFDPADSSGIGALFSAASNTYFDGLLTVGFDARLQMARLGVPPGLPERKIIPMQVAPYLGVSLMEEELRGYVMYNAGPTRYPGQGHVEAAVIYQPEILWPSLQAGLFQPPIGIRYDDHTMFTRRNAPSNSYLIPPNFTELGAQVNYETSWASASAGVFSAHNLSMADPTVESNKPTLSGQVMLWPQLLDEGINGELGATALVNGDFRMINLFAGIGLSDQATLNAEVMLSKNAAERSITNFTVQGSYQTTQWLALEARYERGKTTLPGANDEEAESIVVGAQIFPIPFVELRPEYRLFTKKDVYRLGQYTLQLHLFY